MFRRTTMKCLATVAAVLSLGAAGASFAQEKLPYSLKAGKPYDGTTLNVMLVGTSQFKGLELRAEEFTKLTGIKVVWSEVTFKALQEKVSTAGVAADGAVDIVNYLDSWGPPNAHWFLPLDDRLKQDGISMDRYPAAFAKTSTFNGKVMGLPMRSHVQLFFYRKDIFDELKLAAPQTWEDVVRAGQVIKKAKPGMGPLACYYGADGSRQNLYVWVNFLWGAGAKIFDAKGMPAWDSPAGIQATKDYIALNTTEKICADGSVSMVEQEARIVFMQGKAAMLPIWWWAYSPLINPSSSVLKPEQVAFTGTPAYKGAAVPLINSMPFSISKYSKNQDAAWEFMKWVSNPELEKRNAVERKVAGVDIINNVVNHKVNLLDADINAANASVPKTSAPSLATADVMPMISEWPEVGDLLSIAINKAAAGGDVEQLMKAAAKDSARVLRRAKR